MSDEYIIGQDFKYPHLCAVTGILYIALNPSGAVSTAAAVASQGQGYNITISLILPNEKRYSLIYI
jgi:hypothetical protein